MGNQSLNPLLSASTHSQQQIPWSQDFHLLDKEPLNSTYILHHLPTTTSYKVKHLTLNKLQNAQMFRQIELRSVNPSPFVVQVQKVQQYTVKGYCSQLQEVFVMFKHVENTLKEEILNRRFKKQRFTQQQIKVLLESAVKGISYLNDIGCPPKALNTSQILITPDRAILVNDPLLSVGSILSDTKQRTLLGEYGHKNPIFSIPQEDYPSPEKLLQQNDLIEQYNEWLSELFTLGIIVLEVIFLEPLSEVLYDRGQKKIYYHKVKEKIQEITEGVQLNKWHNLQSQLKFNNQDNNSVSMVSSKVLSQIKQDLRRLLSHEPRIRESVHLKYKKTQGNSLQLNKLSNQYYQNNDMYGNNQSQGKEKYQTNEPNNINERLYAKKQNQFNKFRVVSSSIPSKQPINSKNPFVMPITSQYLIGNLPSVGAQQRILHHLGKSSEVLKNNQHEPESSNIGKTGLQFGSNKLENQFKNANDKFFKYSTFTKNFESPKLNLQSQYALPNSSLTSYPTTWATNQNHKSIPSSTTAYTPSQYFPQFNFPSSSSIHTASNINLSTANVTRSSTSYVVPTTTVSGGSGFDYEKYLIKKVDQKDKMSGIWILAAQKQNHGKEPSNNFTPYSQNFRQYLTSTDPLPQVKKVPSQGTFINFEQWKKMQAFSIQPFVSTSKFSLSKQLSHFPFKQVGSINCDDSHFLADKESFVIQSYGTGMGKLPAPRVETPISTLHSSNMPNLSPKNSFEINHSHISNFRNEGKSFGSVDEDLKQLKKFGINRDTVDKKPYSSYSSSQKVSVIDKIFDPQIMNSQDNKSFQTAPSKLPQPIHNRNSQFLPDSSKQKPRNSSQPYLQTPERYPTKYKLNSTIREASCEDSGVNHSGEHIEEEERVYPNTEVAKYYGFEDRRLSERKVDTKYHNNPKQNRYKYEINGTYVISDANNKQPKPQQKQPIAQQQQQNNSHRVILYADGSRYIGQTDHQGQSHGHGILYYSDGQVAYDGQWLHGDFNGHGKLLNPYPVNTNATYDFNDLTGIDEYLKEYEGEFRRDEKEGKGVLKMQNGEVYEGNFLQDIVHGKGRFYCRDGNVIEGVWERGKLKVLVANQAEK